MINLHCWRCFVATFYTSPRCLCCWWASQGWCGQTVTTLLIATKNRTWCGDGIHVAAHETLRTVPRCRTWHRWCIHTVSTVCGPDTHITSSTFSSSSHLGRIQWRWGAWFDRCCDYKVVLYLNVFEVFLSFEIQLSDIISKSVNVNTKSHSNTYQQRLRNRIDRQQHLRTRPSRRIRGHHCTY